MWVEGVGESSGQVVVAGRRAHSRHVEVGFLQVTSCVEKNLLDVLLGIGMMNELRLELPQDGRVLLGGHVILRQLRVERAEGIPNQATCVLDERPRSGGRGVDEQLAVVDLSTTLVIGMSASKYTVFMVVPVVVIVWVPG